MSRGRSGAIRAPIASLNAHCRTAALDFAPSEQEELSCAVSTTTRASADSAAHSRCRPPYLSELGRRASICACNVWHPYPLTFLAAHGPWCGPSTHCHAPSLSSTHNHTSSLLGLRDLLVVPSELLEGPQREPTRGRGVRTATADRRHAWQVDLAQNRHSPR